MIELRNKFNKLACERAVPRIKPTETFIQPEAEVYPNNPIHTQLHKYKGDLTGADEEDPSSCNKAFNESSTITGGITHITCIHGITKGFSALHHGESPLQVVYPIIQRLAPRVQAKKRIFIYDFACRAQQSALRRFPYNVRNWTFLVDRCHWPNHTSCSSGYNISEYNELKDINTQMAEQINRSLRKLATPLAFTNWKN